jgi:hypothetical protein
MNKIHLLRSVSAILLAGITVSANAALIGILPATQGGADYQAYYDDVIDVTWLADANLAATENFGITTIVAGDGTESYSTMTTWLGEMNNQNGGAGYLGANAWRFPFTPTTDTNCSNVVTDPYLAYWGTGCTESELAHLFNEYGITTTNEGPFSNVENDSLSTQSYWSSEIPLASFVSYAFRFSTGLLLPSSQSPSYYTWAVHDGDISAAVVPVPPALWLFGSALGLLGWMRRKTA